MHPCPSCSCHVHLSDTACPHCGSRLERRSRSAAAALLALGLWGGCVGGGKTDSATGDTGDTQTTPQPLYGAVATTGDTGSMGTLYGVSFTETGGTGTTGTTGDTGATTGVDYGSPGT